MAKGPPREKFEIYLGDLAVIPVQSFTFVLTRFINPFNTGRVFFDRFAKLAVGNKQPYVRYETTIYRLEKTTLT